MMIINSDSDIGAIVIGDGPLADLIGVGLVEIGVDVIREMDHPAYGEDWEDWVDEHADEIRDEAARRGGQA